MPAGTVSKASGISCDRNWDLWIIRCLAPSPVWVAVTIMGLPTVIRGKIERRWFAAFIPMGGKRMGPAQIGKVRPDPESAASSQTAAMPAIY